MANCTPSETIKGKCPSIWQHVHVSTMQDLPLRSEYEQTIAIGEVMNQSLDYLPHIYDTIAFTSPLEGVKL